MSYYKADYDRRFKYLINIYIIYTVEVCIVENILNEDGKGESLSNFDFKTKNGTHAEKTAFKLLTKPQQNEHTTLLKDSIDGQAFLTRRAHKPTFNYVFLLQLNIFNVGQYDSFMLYANALNESLTAGEDPRDGAAIVKRMWNRTFPSK